MPTKSEQSTPASARTARYVMIGGFLGAGKTSAAEKLGQHLKRQGLTAGLISSDQWSETFHDGSFRCRFNSLADAVTGLRDSKQPDIVIAEPAGGGTALAATALSQFPDVFGGNFTLAPLSILVDPIHAARIFGLESGGRFSEQIAYIYRKQIEEADLLVINKSDLVSPEKLAKLKARLAEQARDAMILTVSTRTGAGLEEWFEQILNQERPLRETTPIDHEIYSQGEALLGWLNCSVRLSSVRYFDAGQVLADLANYMQSLLQQEGAEIAHLKIMLTPSDNLGESASINLVHNDTVPDLSQTISEPIQSGEMMLSLRAEADPELLHSAVNRALLTLMERSPQLFARMEHSEHFRPAKPQPGHRDPVLAT